MNHDTIPEGKYLYCIIRCPAGRSFNTRGIGERGDSVGVITYKELAMVVSDSPIVEYDSSRRNMMAHTRVLEEVMQEFTILPVRFGIIAPSEEIVRTQLLQQRYDELCTNLEELGGRIELGLKAFWFEEGIFREIAEANPMISSLRDSLAGRAPEETYYERIRLGEMIEAAMRSQREADAERILTHLRPYVEQTQINPVITDRMVLNAAFLLDRTNEAAFDKAMQELDAAMGERMMFKYVGPVPPYNFVNLTINWS